jgi:hypothetical protein
MMDAMTLYKILSEHEVEFDVVEIFDGVRLIRVTVDEFSKTAEGETENE